ncbi:MAG: adenylyltransferase/cytidyltransferase family protein [bacterium]
MPINVGIFGNDSSFDSRFIPDYQELTELVAHIKALGISIALTSGSFDHFHLGHAMYLEKAREFADLLIVGVDNDDKVRHRKGENRPLFPQQERLNILIRQRSVDIVTLKALEHQRWELIAAVRPDVLVSTKDNYTASEIEEIELTYSCKIVVLERQAETSTSAKVRRLNLDMANGFAKEMNKIMPEVIQGVIDSVLGTDHQGESQ